MAFGEELGVWQMRRTILINADLIDRPERRRKRGAPRIPLGVNEFLGFWSINWIFKYFGKGKKKKKRDLGGSRGSGKLPAPSLGTGRGGKLEWERCFPGPFSFPLFYFWHRLHHTPEGKAGLIWACGYSQKKKSFCGAGLRLLPLPLPPFQHFKKS